MEDAMISLADLAQHNRNKDIWIAVHGKVYGVGAYLDDHPGGEEIILSVAGTDATEAFDDVGHSHDAHETMKTLLKGQLIEYKKPAANILFESTPSTYLSSIGGKRSDARTTVVFLVVVSFLISAIVFLELHTSMVIKNLLAQALSVWQGVNSLPRCNGSSPWAFIALGSVPGLVTLGYLVIQFKQTLEMGSEIEHFVPYLDPQIRVSGPPQYSLNPIQASHSKVMA